jgi:hypothetical protein
MASRQEVRERSADLAVQGVTLVLPVAVRRSWRIISKFRPRPEARQWTPPALHPCDVPQDATAIIPYRQHGDQKTPCTAGPRMRSSQAPCPSRPPCKQPHATPYETRRQWRRGMQRASWPSLAGPSRSACFQPSVSRGPQPLCLPFAPPRANHDQHTSTASSPSTTRPFRLEHYIILIARVPRLHFYHRPCLIPGCSASAKAS